MNMEWLSTHKKTIGYGSLACAVLLLAAAFFGNRPDRQPELFVRIHDQDEYRFVEETDVLDYLHEWEKNNQSLTGVRGRTLKALEDSLTEALTFIRDVQVSRDLKGNLVVDIRQDRPVARIMPDRGTRKGSYLNPEGNLLGLSRNFAPRVLVLSGTGADSLLADGFFRTPYGQDIFRIVEFLNKDKFWGTQITQIDFDQNLNATLYQQVGRQKVEIGKVSDFEKKLAKLMIFYEQIVPKKGWNAYATVRLQYENQIVCE